MTNGKCETCGKEFVRTTGNQKYCCKECRDEAIRKIRGVRVHRVIKEYPTGGELRQFLNDCENMTKKAVAKKWGIGTATVQRWFIRATGEGYCVNKQIRHYKKQATCGRNLIQEAERLAKIDSIVAIEAYRRKHLARARHETWIIPASEIPRGYIA